MSWIEKKVLIEILPLLLRIFNRLKSSNIRECVRIARLAKNDCAQVNRIIDTFAKYGNDKQNVFLK